MNEALSRQAETERRPHLLMHSPVKRGEFPDFQFAVVEKLIDVTIRKALRQLADSFGGTVTPTILWSNQDGDLAGTLAWSSCCEGKSLGLSATLAHIPAELDRHLDCKTVDVTCTGFICGTSRFQRTNEKDFGLEEWVQCQLYECAELLFHYALR